MSGKLYIGQLAELAGINPKTIRYWEEVGLLPEPERSGSGYRLYSREELRRLQFIRKAQALGLSLRELKEIIEIRDQGGLPCEHVRRLLAQKLSELDEHIARMAAFRDELREYISEIERRSSDPREAAICPHIEGYKGPRRPRGNKEGRR